MKKCFFVQHTILIEFFESYGMLEILLLVFATIDSNITNPEKKTLAYDLFLPCIIYHSRIWNRVIITNVEKEKLITDLKKIKSKIKFGAIMKYDIKDLGLADQGRKKAEWAGRELPVLS